MFASVAATPKAFVAQLCPLVEPCVLTANCPRSVSMWRKRPVSDAGDAGEDRDAGQAVAPMERTIPIAPVVVASDCGDRQAIYRAGDGHRTAWTGVFRDGDRAIDGYVIELGLHHSGQQRRT